MTTFDQPACSPSPWLELEGWHLKTASHDTTHCIFLGTCRDLYPSSMSYWMRKDYFGSGSMCEKLRLFSEKLRADCKQEKSLNYIYIIYMFCSNGFDLWGPEQKHGIVYFFIARSLLGGMAVKDPGCFQAVHASKHWIGYGKQIPRTIFYFQGCLSQELVVVFCQRGNQYSGKVP